MGNVRDFSSYFMKPGTAAKCGKKCLGDISCDELVVEFTRTCQQLEKDFHCNCQGCQCKTPQVTTEPPTTLDQNYQYKWIKYTDRDCIGAGASLEASSLFIGENGKDHSLEATVQHCQQTCAASKNCAGFVDRTDNCHYFFYIPSADKLEASQLSDCYRYNQPLSSSTATTTTTTTGALGLLFFYLGGAER